MSASSDVNRILQEQAPGVWESLSSLGREAVYPPDIPFQAAQARGTRYNATIGQITDGAGSVLALPAVAATLAELNAEDLSRALLYSPMEGLPELREGWHQWQRPGGAAASSLPFVTVGLTHALALVADLFAGPGRRILVPAPFWGNYRQTFGLRTGATVEAVAAYRQRRWQPGALGERLAQLPEGEPATVILNLPSNPGGYSPTAQEREILLESLIAAAEHRPLVVICDDAYSGLVYEPAIPCESLFWQLIDRHPQLLPVRLAGATKEFVLFGARIGFITWPFAPDSPVTAALENKLCCLQRAGVGSPVALSQVVLLQALRKGAIADEVQQVISRLGRRYRVLREVLAAAEKETDLFRSLPFNSGVFALLELAEGLEADAARQRLIDSENTGLIAVGDRYLRIAFCSVAADDLPGLVKRICSGLDGMRRQGGS